MEGNLARKFRGFWPEAWDEVVGTLELPFQLGAVQLVDVKDLCPFAWAIIASTLDHTEALSSAERCEVVWRAFSTCLELCAQHGISSLATTVMTGGWRLPPEPAFAAMLSAYIGRGLVQREKMELSICTLDSETQAMVLRLMNKSASGKN
jgi:hypothetical protein